MCADESPGHSDSDWQQPDPAPPAPGQEGDGGRSECGGNGCVTRGKAKPLSRLAVDHDSADELGGPGPIHQILESDGGVVGDQAGGEKLEGQPNAPAQQRDARHDEDRAISAQLHYQPQEPVQPTRQAVYEVKERRLETRDPGDGCNERTGCQQDRTEDHAYDISWMTAIWNVRSCRQAHGSFSQALWSGASHGGFADRGAR